MNDPGSKLPVVLFVLLLALCATLAVVFLLGEIPSQEAAGGGELVALGHGTTHPAFSSMDHGGDGFVRHGTRLWVGWVFGVLQLALIVGCLALGVRRPRAVQGPLLASGIVIGLMMTMMIITYRGYLEGATPVLFWSLPAPTAWFLYGFWPAQFLVVVLYVVAFSRSLVTPGDLRRFQEILNTSRAGGTDG
ncbi:MAG: hypothetical protein VYE68_13840 [Acidobacteriota bacterium]|nr:hypothetical protein [Acidobacteriota bacterium]